MVADYSQGTGNEIAEQPLNVLFRLDQAEQFQDY